MGKSFASPPPTPAGGGSGAFFFFLPQTITRAFACSRPSDPLFLAREAGGCRLSCTLGGCEAFAPQLASRNGPPSDRFGKREGEEEKSGEKRSPVPRKRPAGTLMSAICRRDFPRPKSASPASVFRSGLPRTRCDRSLLFIRMEMGLSGACRLGADWAREKGGEQQRAFFGVCLFAKFHFRRGNSLSLLLSLSDLVSLSISNVLLHLSAPPGGNAINTVKKTQRLNLRGWGLAQNSY